MKDFYTRFYTAIQHSRAHSLFCERVFGLDLGQHGFADVQQLDLLLETAALTPRSRALDMGCGDGRITEYLSDRSGAHFVGLDYIEAAVEAAMTRTAPKRERLSFLTGDLNHLEPPAGVYDALNLFDAVNLLDAVLSIDSLYFSEDYPRTLRQMADLLKPGGMLLILFSHGREPWVPLEEFDPLTLPPANTPVGQALAELGFPFQTVELTDADYRLALRRKEVLDDLRGMFEAEGNLFLYDNRMGDACGISDAIKRGLQRRYLYCVQPSGRRD